MREETSSGQHHSPRNSSGWARLPADRACGRLLVAAGLGTALSCSPAGSPGYAPSINPCAPELRESAPLDERFEPAGLPNVPLGGVAGVLVLYASTLQLGNEGPELYAGICNDGAALLCGAAIQIEFYDQADELIGMASGGVQSGQLYSFSEDAAPISCVAPGEVAMAVVTDLPEGLLINELGSVGHRFPAFQIEDAEPIPSVDVTELHVAQIAAGTVFEGTVTNDAATTVSDPAVSVFPVNAAGRPLGHAVGTEVLQLPPGGTWSFRTSVVGDVGVTQFVFASGTLMPAR